MLITRYIKIDSNLYKKINGLIKSCDRLFFIRPILFLIVWTFVAAGLSRYYGLTTPEFYWHKSFNVYFLFLFIGITLISSSAALVNKEFFSNGIVLFLLILGLLCFIASIFLDKNNSLMSTQVYQAGAWILVFYSIWRILLKNHEQIFQDKISLRIFIGSFSSLSLFMTGWTIGGGSFLNGIYSSLPYVLSFCAVFIFYPLAIKAEKIDYNDYLNNVNKITLISFILFTLSTAIGYFINDPVISTAGVIITPFFLVSLIVPKAEHILRAFRYPLFILSIFIGVKLPWLLLGLFITSSIIRLYNYFRFGIVFPTLKVIND